MGVDEVRFVEANRLRFASLESGRGPLVLLVHGLPDTARSWDATRPAVAAMGFRAVARYTRGYAPTEVPREEAYDADTLGRDLLALIHALGAESAVIVGHDWGASAAYSAAAMEPDAVRLLVTLAIPHPAAILPTPRVFWAVRHVFALQQRRALRWVPDRDFAYLDTLVRRWSPAWNAAPAETDAVKAVFRDPRSLNAALGYYRAFRPWLPASQRKKIRVPTVCFALETDIFPPQAYERAAARFTGSYEIVRMPGGHFMHREYPDLFNEKLLRVLERVRRDVPRSA